MNNPDTETVDAVARHNEQMAQKLTTPTPSFLHDAEKELDHLRSSLENLRHDVRAAVYLLRASKPTSAVRLLERALQ